MSRATLRLVEPLESSLDFPQGKSEAVGVREITASHEIHSHLQLFFSWPEYSSVILKVGHETVKAKITIDECLSELEEIYITIDEPCYKKIAQNRNILERVYVEVFGITFGFTPVVQDCVTEFSEGLPCLSIFIPSALTRYSMRGTKRVPLSTPQSIDISYRGESFGAMLTDVSPQAFCIKTAYAFQPFEDRVTVKIDCCTFDVMVTKATNNQLIIKPLSEEPVNFGHYFDLYVKHAYPMLKSRYLFPEDPIPLLLNTTGQAKKHASSEKSATWVDKIHAAYSAGKDVLNSHVAQYVAVDTSNKPIGTSALASAFISKDGNPVWIFHGLGTGQNPEQLDITCSLYNWRVDYLLAKNDKANISMWFDGRGKWLEKVYVKFSRLTSDETQIWPIKHNRYERLSAEKEPSKSLNEGVLYQSVRIGVYERDLYASDEIIAGFGVPYLNYSGILNNISFVNPRSAKKDKSDIASVIQHAKPEIFFLETPVEHEDYEIENYEKRFVDATNRQCKTNGHALKFFTSSLEHSKALVKKKYGT